jgi:phosphatidylethanolamine/phosphatidyl-N-methylethanolamine N-methyltransferase
MMSSRAGDQSSNFYNENYKKIFSSGKIGLMWASIHRQMERPFNTARSNSILEIGAGSGEHLPFVQDDYTTYIQSDIDVSNLLISGGGEIHEEDATKLSYLDNSFDRTIVTCVLVHLYEPELAISELVRVTKDGGSITIYIPCEPGVLLRWAQRNFTEKKMRKLGTQNPRFLHFLEHRGNFFALDFFIRQANSESKIKRTFYPFRIPLMSLNLYVIYQIRVSKQ